MAHDDESIDEVTRLFLEGSELLTRYRKVAANHPELEFYTLGNVCFGARIPGRAPIVRTDLGTLLDDLETLYRGEVKQGKRVPGGTI